MIDWAAVTGFDWDAGNARKSVDKHDVSQAEAEQIFFNEPLLLAHDLPHSEQEPRFHALGKTEEGRLLHITFTLRGAGRLIRIISARDMHRKERRFYEQETKSNRFTYKPTYDDATDKRRVAVTITGPQDKPLGIYAWNVQVRNVDRPPQLEPLSPQVGSIPVDVASVLAAKVKVKDPDPSDRLTVIWKLDGREIATGEQANIKIPLQEGKYTLVAEATDSEGLSDRAEWLLIAKAKVEPAPPPVLSRIDPSTSTVKINNGDAITLSVRADLPGSSRTALTALQYEWHLNDKRVQKGNNNQYRFAETQPGKYRVAVIARTTEGLKSNPQEWTLEVAAVEQPSRTKIAALSEGEVRQWLETYRQTWESKKVEVLYTWGELPSREAASQLESVLNQYTTFRVALTDVQIRLDGSKATISFGRVDTIDNKTLRHPDRKTLRLEKQANGNLQIIR